VPTTNRERKQLDVDSLSAKRVNLLAHEPAAPRRRFVRRDVGDHEDAHGGQRIRVFLHIGD
jgi:hypothetical protein